MNLLASVSYSIRGLELVVGKTRTEPYVYQFRWPDGETPWTDTLPDACSYTSMAPNRVTVAQAQTAMKRARERARKS